jgi:hypothetical protein
MIVGIIYGQAFRRGSDIQAVVSAEESEGWVIALAEKLLSRKRGGQLNGIIYVQPVLR